MIYHNPSKDWDNKERKMDEADIKAGEDPEPEAKVEVNVHTEKPENELPLSGLFCIHCHGYAIYIYEGMSICHDCYNEEVSDLIKEKHKK